MPPEDPPNSASVIALPCPYAACSGRVRAGDRRCETCRRELLTPAAVSSGSSQILTALRAGLTPSVGNRGSRRTDLAPLIADVYRGASLANANMRSVADALESLRSEVAPEADVFSLWTQISGHIGRAGSADGQSALQALRERFIECAAADAVTSVGAAYERSAEDGWNEWLRSFAAGLLGWRLPLCVALLDAVRSVPQVEAPAVDALRRWTRYLQQEQWPETYELYSFLTEHAALSDDVRADLLVTRAEIELYHFDRPERAKSLLERAQQLQPDSMEVLRGWGGYWSARGDKERGLTYYEMMIERDPRSVQGHLGRGDCRLQGIAPDDKESLAAAEESYQEAVRCDPGYSGGYLSLLRLLGWSEMFRTRKEQIRPLVNRIIAVDQDSEYAAYLAAGDAHRQNGEHEQAHLWFQAAIAVDPTRVHGYGYRGDAYLGEEELDRALDCYQASIDAAPELADGYSNLGWFHEYQEQWAEALACYQQARVRRPHWNVITGAKIAEMQAKLRVYAEAEATLIDASRTDPGNDRLIGAARTVGLALNQEGNEHYERGDFHQAGLRYGAAAGFLPDDAVIHSNLALALTQPAELATGIEALDRAAAALRRACELDPGTAEYASRLAAVELQQHLVATHGQAALSLVPAVAPIIVEVAPDLLEDLLSPGTFDLSPDVVHRLGALREGLRQTFGVPLPGVSVRQLIGDWVTDGTYVLSVMEIPVAYGEVDRGKRFHPGSPDVLTSLGIEHTVGIDPRTGAPGCWIDQQYAGKAESAGLELWRAADYLFHHLEAVLVRNLSEFLDHQQVAAMAPAVGACQGAVSSGARLTDLTLVLRALTSEMVPIVALDAICAEMTRQIEDGATLSAAVERVRSLPEVRAHLAGNSDGFAPEPIDATIEHSLAGYVVSDAPQPILALPSGRVDEALAAVRAQLSAKESPVLVVEAPELRPLVRKLLDVEVRSIPVLSRGELIPALVSQLDARA
jgi:tetratricopeptide (TPR) repeat protein